MSKRKKECKEEELSDEELHIIRQAEYLEKKKAEQKQAKFHEENN